MTKMEIFDRDGFSGNPDCERFFTIVERLKEHGILIECHRSRNPPDAFSANASVSRILAQQGETALPVTTVNGFVMITGRYPANEEIRQILNIPRQLIEPKSEGCCCIQGCGCTGGRL